MKRAGFSRRPRRFVLLGAAGYIAPRHLKALADTGQEVVAACDPHDSVGILDSYFPDAKYFRSLPELEHFIRLEAAEGRPIGGVSVCSPNHLHHEHVLWGLGLGADVVCEKPLVLDPAHIDALQAACRQFDKKVYPVLQLREHEAIQRLRERVRLQARPDDGSGSECSTASSNGSGSECSTAVGRHDVELSYVTGRGAWYFSSWKGAPEQSGGLAANIGIHFFDMLIWIFGSVEEFLVEERSEHTMRGRVQLQRANVRWLLSVNRDAVPAAARRRGHTTHRQLVIDGEPFDFSRGFSDLHTTVYENALSTQGHGPEDARAAIELARGIQLGAVGRWQDQPCSSPPASPASIGIQPRGVEVQP